MRARGLRVGFLAARRWSARHIHWAGWAAPLVVLAGSVIAGTAYADNAGAGYSIFAKTISELGNAHRSPLHGVFNGSLILGGLILSVFIAGVGLVLHRPVTYGIAAVGVLAALGMSLVGLFPNSGPTGPYHVPVAGTAFFFFLLLGASYSAYGFFHRDPVLHRWLVAVSGWGALVVAVFMAVVAGRQLRWYPRGWLDVRVPLVETDVQVICTLEWLVLFSILTWSGATALSLALRRGVLSVD